MKTLSLFFLALIIVTNLFSQQLESIGAGVVDFLLTNPSTVDHTNATQEAALMVIGNLLNQSAQRKHEVNVAKAGRNEIVINTSNGNQATLYSDDNGNIYLLSNGKIYPITSSLVNQAKSEFVKPTMVSTRPININATLPDYNLEDLKDKFKFERKTSVDTTRELKRYYMGEETEFLNSIASRFNVTLDDIYFIPYIFVDNKGNKLNKQGNNGKIIYTNFKHNKVSLLNLQLDSKYLTGVRNVYSMQEPLVRTAYGCKEFTHPNAFKSGLAFIFPGIKGYQNASGFAIYINTINRISKESFFKLNIVTTFTCNWAKDFDGQGLDFEDFQGIKRSFLKDENILFVLGYTSEIDGEWSFEIFNATSGKTLDTTSGKAEKGGRIVTTNVEGGKLLEGAYIYNFTLRMEGQNPTSKMEKFEIIKK